MSRRIKGFFVVWLRVWTTTSGPLIDRLRVTTRVWKMYGCGSRFES